jgi:hypothetical protein
MKLVIEYWTGEYDTTTRNVFVVEAVSKEQFLKDWEKAVKERNRVYKKYSKARTAYSNHVFFGKISDPDFDEEKNKTFVMDNLWSMGSIRLGKYQLPYDGDTPEIFTLDEWFEYAKPSTWKEEE